MGLVFIMASGLWAAFFPQPRNITPSALGVLVNVFTVAVFMFLAPWVTFKLASVKSRNLNVVPEDNSSLKPRMGFWKAFFTGAGVMVAVLPVVGLVAAGVEMLLNWLGISADPQDPVKWLMSPKTSISAKWVIVASVILVAPVTEELFFRYTLYRVLDCRLKGRFAAALVVAALFAGIHFNIIAFVPVFCLSIVFSELMRRTGHFAAPVAAHMVFNAVSVLLVFLGFES